MAGQQLSDDLLKFLNKHFLGDPKQAFGDILEFQLQKAVDEAGGGGGGGAPIVTTDPVAPALNEQWILRVPEVAPTFATASSTAF